MTLELAGVVRCTHYSLMVYGYNRLPIVSWLKGNAGESLGREKTAIQAYNDLLKISEGKSVLLEEYARELIVSEELHLDQVNKMLRMPGDIGPLRD